MQMQNQRGFTLIELLVVIAIIGILSAVVLASLSTARSKGNDAALQSNMATIQTQAEIYYGGTGSNSYGATVNNASGCPTISGLWSDPTVKNAVAGIIGNAKSGTIECNSTGTAYMIEAQLNATTTTAYWCLDSTGRTTYEYSLSGSGVTACP